MKHYLCHAIALLLLLGYSQASTVPPFVELKEEVGGIVSAVFSPDGTKVATISAGTAVRIWDAVSGKELHVLEHRFSVSSAVFSPDGRKVVTVAIDGTARIWNLEEAAGENCLEEKWLPLFDGESLEGWSIPVYGGDGEVDVLGGNIVIGRGLMMTGIRYEREFPRINYEIRYEARRTQGFDFFAACTFPVKEGYTTFINGGWGGWLTGLSNVDGVDASENPTTTSFQFRDNVWYRFRIRVAEEMIQVWITPRNREGHWEEEEFLFELALEGKRMTTRFEVDKYKPLGFTTWATEGQLRNIEYRMLE